MYWQHRCMVWLPAGEFDAPGLLYPQASEYPEGKAAMCETFFPVEIAALKALVKARLRHAIQPMETEAQAIPKMEVVLKRRQRQFVGKQPKPSLEDIRRATLKEETDDVT